MPILTVYAYLGPANTRFAIMTIEDWPASYDDLKDVLLGAAQIIYNEHGEISDVSVSLEHHLKGRMIGSADSSPSGLKQNNPMRVSPGGYREAQLHFRRSPEFSCRLIYNHLTKTVEVKSAVFGPHLYKVAYDDYKAEHGQANYVPPLIPKRHQLLRGNPEAIFAQPPDNVQSGYELGEPKNASYDLGGAQGSYAMDLSQSYSLKGKRIFKEDEFNEDHENTR